MTKKTITKICRMSIVVVTMLSVMFTAWLTASWMDIASDNCSDNPTHSAYNAFIVMNNLAENGD